MGAPMAMGKVTVISNHGSVDPLAQQHHGNGGRMIVDDVTITAGMTVVRLLPGQQVFVVEIAMGIKQTAVTVLLHQDLRVVLLHGINKLHHHLLPAVNQATVGMVDILVVMAIPLAGTLLRKVWVLLQDSVEALVVLALPLVSELCSSTTVAMGLPEVLHLPHPQVMLLLHR